MNCKNHENVEASGMCTYCGKPFCNDCLVEIKGKMYCKNDLDKVFDENDGLSDLDESKNPNSEDVASKKQNIMYELTSGAHVDLWSMTRGRIYYKIYLNEDRIEFQIIPKRINKSPVILYSDILKTEMKLAFSSGCIVFAIIGLICMIANPAFILLSILYIWLGINHKVIIYQRNGIPVVIYSRKKDIAENLEKDIKQRTGLA